MILYLQGAPSNDGEHIHCSLSSSTILFVIRYCQTTYDIVFVPDSQTNISMRCPLSRRMFSDLNLTFTPWTDVPPLIRNVSLPSLHQPELPLVRSGLCVLLRHIISDSHITAPHLHLVDLLGFRQGSMKMCSEVSGFTKLCEVELPESVSQLMDTLKDVSPDKGEHINRRPQEVPVPSALIKLDCHFMKKCRVHNDNKTRRVEIAKIKKLFSESLRNKTFVKENRPGQEVETESGNVLSEEALPDHLCGKSFSLQNGQSHCNGSPTPSRHSALISSENESLRVEVEQLSHRDSWLHIEHVAHLHHGIRRLKVDKHFSNSWDMQTRCAGTSCDESLGKSVGQKEAPLDAKSADGLTPNTSRQAKSADCLTSNTSSPADGLTPNTSSPADGLTPNTSSPADGLTPNTSSPADGLTPNTSRTAKSADGLTPNTSRQAKSADGLTPTSSPADGLTPNTSRQAKSADGLTPNTSRTAKSADGLTPNTSRTAKSADGLTPNTSRTAKSASLLLDDVAELVEQLSYVDIAYEHTYSEGIEMTLADLILYVYVYHLLEALGFSCVSLAPHVPSILQWASHMTSIGTVVSAGHRLGWDMESFVTCLRTRTEDGNAGENRRQNIEVVFIKGAEIEENIDDEMELSRCAKMKHRALKPEVTQVLQRFETANIKLVKGDHCCGDQVEVDWDILPAAVHPREGDVPDSRTQRKCQQLENLLTAVQTLARAGDIIVDFCSGGGHLGILMAYLLPNCQVYLVENKEESLLKACSRLEALALRNVTMYQCNLDYFGGTFDIGVSLHACGSATDMVLQLCLNSRASFVVCPCCYGSIQKTHLLTYPQSKQFIDACVSYKDFLTLGHAADQTELNIALEEQGRQCMNLVDTDRAQLARELGYTVTLCSLRPLTCTPKNNLLIGSLSGW